MKPEERRRDSYGQGPIAHGPTPETGGFLTVLELAKRMRVSKMTVYRMVKDGVLPSVKFGRSIRVPQDAYDRYVKEQTEEAVR